MSHNIEIGLALSPDYHPVDQLIQFAPKLDEMGYSQISVPEIWGHDSITFLSLLAHVTKSIEISTGIISMYSRTPALVAMTAASLDEISHGRFILGLGLSGPKVIENWHGMSFNKPLQRTEEFIDVVRTILKKKRLDHNTSQLGHLKDFKISIRNVRADLPMHIAAIGPKNVELTARIADGWIPIMMTKNSMKNETNRVKEMVKTSGKDPVKFSITPFIPTIIGDSENDLNLLRGHLGYYLGAMGSFYNNMLKRAGFEDEANEIKSHYQKGDIVAGNMAITREILEEICVFGNPDDAREQLVNMVNSGITRPLLMVPFRTKLEQVLRTIEELSPNKFSI